MTLPRIAVTMGDPAGIGPELALKLLAKPGIREFCTPIIYGGLDLLNSLADKLDWPMPDPAEVFDIPTEPPEVFEPGEVSASCGKAAYQYFTAAIDDALAGRVDAIATCPINKESLHAAGFPFPGHTEILASRTNAERSCMMLTAPEITCSLVTVHVGYREVPSLLTTERILDVLELTAAAMERMRSKKPRLTVCGLNPHAGEHGLFGEREEERIIEPAIAAARAKGHQVVGPLPPDTAFIPRQREDTDAYICMYHDQGLIPLKALAFDQAVNITLGLPIIRTSVDHGTAFDIAWQGVADVSSLVHAVTLAAKLCGDSPQRHKDHTKKHKEDD
jgi:4-hydroxythreonine-4-phosphate dehydrogenase